MIAGISPGPYTVTVSAPGFKPFERKGINLSVGQMLGLDIRMQVGDLSTEISVDGGDVTIQVANEGRLADTLKSEISALPLPQRDVFLLPKLSAGATFITGQANATKLANSPIITVNGNRYRGNNYVLDGATNVNPNNTGEPTVVPSVESVEEAQVQTENFSSEFGRGNGVVVNLRTKSGTNEFHGRAWDYDRNAWFNARNFFAPVRAPLTFNQFGGNLGGPVIKNKTFFFGSYEGARSVSGQALTFQVETPEFRDYVIRTSPKSVAAQLLQKYPAPTPQAGTGSSRYAGQIDLVTPGGTIPAIGRAATILKNNSGFDQYMFKVDHSFNNGLDKLTGRWISELQRHDGGSSFNAATLGKAVRGMRGPFDGTFSNLNLGYMHVFARAVNDFRFSTQLINAVTGIDNAVIPEVLITGITMGFGDIVSSGTRLRTYEYRDTVILDRGKHSLKIGFEARRIFKGIALGPAAPGTFNFSSLADFAADKPFRQSVTVDPVSGAPTPYPRYFHVNENAIFLQEDWRATSRLNVSIGVRNDYFGDAIERDNKMSSIIWGKGNTLEERLATASLGRVDRFYKPSKINISPRIGLAFDPFGDGRSSIRAGFGIAYQPPHGQSVAGARPLPPDAITGQIQPSNNIGTQILYGIPVPFNPEFARGLNAQGGLISKPGEPAIRLTGYTVDPNLKTQYSESWFFNVQREVARGWIVELGYVGTRGVNLERYDDINRVAGDLLDGKENRINPNFATLLFFTNGVNSIYHGGTAELRHKFGKGFSLQTNYRFSKWLDTSSDTSSVQFTDNSEPGKGAQNYNCLSCERGRSLFDIPHRYSASLTWSAPFGHSNKSFLGTLQRNWEVASIVTAQSGRPFSVFSGAPSRIVNGVNLGGDFNLDGGGGGVLGGFYDRPNAPVVPINRSFSRSDFINGLFDPNVFPSPALGQTGNLGRGVFRGPRYIGFDLSLGRTFKIDERKSLQFRVESFNAFNNVNLYMPNVDLSLALKTDGTYNTTSIFGKSTQASDPRIYQLGLKFMF